MTPSRERILRRLRQRPGKPSPPLPDNPVRRFDWSPETSRQQFVQRLEEAHGEIHPVGEDWPVRLCQLLQEKGLRRLLCAPETAHGAALRACCPAALGIRWRSAQPVEECRAVLFDQVDAAFTGCRGAIAETGSLVLWPTPEEPRLWSLVPPVHIVLLDAGRIYSTLHECLVVEDWAGQGLPTNVLLISGPSKSADIEQTLAYGVHGPRELIVLLHAAP